MTDVAVNNADVEAPILVGSGPLVLDEATIESLPSASVDAEVVCATGSRYTAEWVGVDIATLLDEAAAPSETTHLTFEAADGYRIAVPVTDALQGVLAFEKDGRPIGSEHPYPNRFVAPDVEGARDVKGVSRIGFHALGPDEDPDSLEQVEPIDDRFEADR